MGKIIIIVCVIQMFFQFWFFIKWLKMCSNIESLKTKLCDYHYINTDSETNEYQGIKVGDKVIRKRDGKEVEIIKIYSIGDYNYLACDVVNTKRLIRCGEYYNREDFEIKKNK